MKLGVDLLLGIGLALLTQLAVARASDRAGQGRLAREALVTILYGYTLASLALVGQIYQLNAPTYQALATWSLATLPLCLLGESLFLAVLYSAGVVTTHAFALSALFDALEANASDALARNIAACVVFASPLLYVLSSYIPQLAHRPHWVWSLRTCGALGVLLGGFGLPFFWYEGISGDDALTWSLAVTLLFALSFSWFLWRMLASGPQRARTAVVSVVPLGWLLLVFCCGFGHDGADYIAGIAQIAWLALCAFVSYRALWLRVFNALTALLALRILVVYFEVFGTLLDTGVGLVTGGLLTLLIAWFWQQKIRQLAERARTRTGEPGVA